MRDLYDKFTIPDLLLNEIRVVAYHLYCIRKDDLAEEVSSDEQKDNDW